MGKICWKCVLRRRAADIWFVAHSKLFEGLFPAHEVTAARYYWQDVKTLTEGHEHVG